eukprot:394074_1
MREMRLSQQQEDSLFHGYARSHSINMPKDICTVIKCFWEKYIWCSFNGDTVTGKTVNTNNDIYISPLIYPNGSINKNDLSATGYVQCCVNIQRINQHMASMFLLVEIYCFQTKSFWRDTWKLSRPQHTRQWGKYQLSLDECVRHPSLDFRFSFNVLAIKYQEMRINYFSPIQILKKCSSLWVIKPKTLLAFQDYPDRVYFGSLFNNKCWSLYCVPRRLKGRKKEYFKVGLCKYRNFEPKYTRITFDIKPHIFHKSKNYSKNCQHAPGIGWQDVWISFNTKHTLQQIIAKSNNSVISIRAQIVTV